MMRWIGTCGRLCVHANRGLTCIHLQSQSDIATQYEEVMTKVHTLNVISDSNRLLRDERDQLTKQVCTLYNSVVSFGTCHHRLASERE